MTYAIGTDARPTRTNNYWPTWLPVLPVTRQREQNVVLCLDSGVVRNPKTGVEGIAENIAGKVQGSYGDGPVALRLQ